MSIFPYTTIQRYISTIFIDTTITMWNTISNFSFIVLRIPIMKVKITPWNCPYVGVAIFSRFTKGFFLFFRLHHFRPEFRLHLLFFLSALARCHHHATDKGRNAHCNIKRYIHSNDVNLLPSHFACKYTKKTLKRQKFARLLVVIFGQFKTFHYLCLRRRYKDYALWQRRNEHTSALTGH